MVSSEAAKKTVWGMWGSVLAVLDDCLRLENQRDETLLKPAQEISVPTAWCVPLESRPAEKEPLRLKIKWFSQDLCAILKERLSGMTPEVPKYLDVFMDTTALDSGAFEILWRVKPPLGTVYVPSHLAKFAVNQRLQQPPDRAPKAEAQTCH